MGKERWYVITGGPCAGKTTLIEGLKKRGYRTVPEAARAYIEEELGNGRTTEEIRRDEAAFQRVVIEKKVAVEKTLPKDELLFFDRGMHDSIAYLRAQGIEHDQRLAAAIRDTSYRTVFLLEMLPYVGDAARTESAEEGKRIHSFIEEAYRQSAIPVISVPVLPVEKRVDFVLAHLQ